MAAINDLTVPVPTGATSHIVDTVKEAVGRAFWRWFTTHQNEPIAKIKWWFIRKTIYWRDVTAIFVALFGPNPFQLPAAARKDDHRHGPIEWVVG